MSYKVVATNFSDNLPDQVLNTFEDLDECENWRPHNIDELQKLGYTHLEIVPDGWANCHLGYTSFAKISLQECHIQ